jgi:hypothetical protein
MMELARGGGGFQESGNSEEIARAGKGIPNNRDYLASLTGVEVFDAPANINNLPARSTNTDFYGTRVFPGLDATEPGAFAYRD